jgi:chemotaxis protein MotD
VNAIEQYVAPAPVRPDASQQQSGNPAANADGASSQSFGDVYNRAANNGQSDTNKNANAKPGKTSQDAATADGDAVPAQSGTEKKSSAGVTSAIFKLAADAKAATTDEKAVTKDDTDANAKLTADDKKGSTKEAAPIAKTSVLPETVSTVTEEATTSEADNAAIALKLLGAAGRSKKATTDETDGKADAADAKAADAADAADANGKADDTKSDATSAMLAASLVVTGQSGQQGKQQDQPKQKPEDANLAKAASSIAAPGKGVSDTDDVPGVSSEQTAKPESVTVVDARRFVGAGQTVSANTQAVVSGMKSDGDWATAMKAASAQATAAAVPEHKTATPVNTLKIQMTPESLGNVTATLRLHGDQLTVHLTVESGEAFKQLSHDKDGLVQSLKSQGFTVDQVSIQLTPATTTSDKAVAQTSTGQQSGGQMQDGSSAGQFAQQGRGQENNRRQQENGIPTSWQGDEKSSVFDSGSAAADAPRTGQVYL